MKLSSLFKVKFIQNGTNHTEDVIANTQSEATYYIEDKYSNVKIVNVTNSTREDLVALIVNLVLADIKWHPNPHVQSLVQKSISSFAAVADTRYHHYVDGQEPDSVASTVKSIINRIANG